MYLNEFAAGPRCARHDGCRGVPQPAAERKRSRHPAPGGRALRLAQYRGATAALPLPGVGRSRRSAAGVAPWGQPVRALLGPRQPSPGGALPRAGARPARTRRQRMGARRRLRHRRDGRGRDRLHRAAGPRAPDRDGALDGRARHHGGAEAPAGHRACRRLCRRRPGDQRRGHARDPRLHPAQHRVRRPRRVHRAGGGVRPATARASTSRGRCATT